MKDIIDAIAEYTEEEGDLGHALSQAYVDAGMRLGVCAGVAARAHLANLIWILRVEGAEAAADRQRFLDRVAQVWDVVMVAEDDCDQVS